MATSPHAGGAAPLHIVIAGHVDHGKSTLIGRLLHETGALPDGKLAELEAAARRRGTDVEWSFVLDAFQAERNQAVTIDTTRVRFATAQRDYVIVDAPGHREFLRNMISGAAACDAAILVIDAQAGLEEQTRRHGYLLHLLSVRDIVVAVNKMDLVGHDPQRFETIAAEARTFFAGLGRVPARIVPVAARTGANLSLPAPEMAWHDGPTLLEAMDALPGRADRDSMPLRLDIQDVYHFDGRRILAGRVRAGRFHVGDRLQFSPGGGVARVASVEAWSVKAPPLGGRAGDSVGITLDTPLFVERGAVASHPEQAPLLTTVFRGRVFWLAETPLTVPRTLTLKIGTTETRATVEAVERLIDPDRPETATDAPAPAVRTDRVERNGIADLVIRTAAQIAVDGHGTPDAVSRFVLVDGYRVVGGGLVSMDGYPDQRLALHTGQPHLHPVAHAVTIAERTARNGHKGGVLWLTGLSGAGKSTLAMATERALFAAGWQVYVLDGDNVRSGLNADLGFSPEDRSENIRRVAEVARLFADAGMIVIAAFISPYRDDRERARRTIGGDFHEVHVRADLETCRRRDPKGLYEKAGAQTLKNFTGVSAPYEEPDAPDLVIDTDTAPVAAGVERLFGYARRVFAVG